MNGGWPLSQTAVRTIIVQFNQIGDLWHKVQLSIVNRIIDNQSNKKLKLLITLIGDLYKYAAVRAQKHMDAINA
jgi:hypothetical protein